MEDSHSYQNIMHNGLRKYSSTKLKEYLGIKMRAALLSPDSYTSLKLVTF